MQDERRQARDEMRLFEKASASLSDGDLVDAMIHGSVFLSQSKDHILTSLSQQRPALELDASARCLVDHSACVVHLR